MKIAHLTTVDLSLRYLIFPQLLAARDAGAEVIGISAPGPYVEDLEAEGIRHVPLRSSTRGMDLMADLRSIAELWGVLRREKPDILHTHNPKPGLYGRILGRLAGVPVVINTVHGLYATRDDSFAKRVLVYGLEAIASRFSDIELVQSGEDHELLTRWRISSRRKTRRLGNGVDLARFDSDRFSETHRRQIRAELGVVEDVVVVGMVGRLVAEKGYPELFEASRRLGDRYQVVVIGPHDPDKSDALPDAQVRRAADSGVLFLGMRTDVDRLYAVMDLFVLPSHREGFPRAAMEAAAMGIPIVATDIRGCREVVEDGVTGLLVPVRNVDALTMAIQTLGTDRQLRERMGDAVIRRAAERFDEREVVRRVLAAYADAGFSYELDGRIFDQEATIRSARASDVRRIAELHHDGIATGFLRRLGRRFLEILYDALIEWQKGHVLVAERDGVIGFIAGVEDTGAFYRYFVKRYGFRAGLTALPHLIRPSSIIRARETLRYGADRPQHEVVAELLATAVDVRARGRGIGRRLGEELFAAAIAQGVHRMTVVAGADNDAAIAMYRKLGFGSPRTVEVHVGEPSVEMLWSSSGS